MVSSINFLLFIVMFAMVSIVYKISLATEENVLGFCCVCRYYLAAAGLPLGELLPAVRSQTQHTFRTLRTIQLLIHTVVYFGL